MNKLKIFAFLCFVLCKSTDGYVNEKFRGNDGYLFQLDLDDHRCCKDTCLNAENSKKISDAVLTVLKLNGMTYTNLKALMIVDFMTANIVYEEFADNIKNHDYILRGYTMLQNLVNRYKICPGIKCEVYFELRQAIRKMVEDSEMFVEPQSDGSKQLIFSGDLLVLSDILPYIENAFTNDPEIKSVYFDTPLFIVDTNLLNSAWHGKSVTVGAYTIYIVNNVLWDVRGATGEFQD